jgi:gliding motility-associated-like protein
MIIKPLLALKLALLFILLFTITTNTEAALKRHKVTVGMYNTYSILDGNLGRSEADLKEVWEGVSSVSGCEACNITQHYWPRPYDLPSVESGQDPYAVWWKDYMEEACNLTNQNGEVRLKVIIGPLYGYYVIYKGDVFNDFIKELCLWEKGSKYEGTLAGWYVTEEPMGSSHNFDPNICNDMVDAIKAVEKSVGVQHKIYIDVSVDGLYFTPDKLSKFTRQADVVMISASTYLWTTSAKQPVYNPDWKSIHGPMKIVRDIIYPYRDKLKLPRPEIHAVLEARDAIGHGQPTNWEMRQQINIALSQSVQYNDPPADGVWFFWWSEIGKNAKDDSDDWNNGRRIAEAIQVQVPRSTFAENLSIKKDVDPEKTRFRFPQSGSFNPTNSCIPYDLAESGEVRIEILNERKSLVKKFDMKYQVAGNLARFGGPYWEKGNNKNGTYTFLLYLNSKLMDEVNVKVQWSIILNSASHLPGAWSQNNVVDVQWEPEPEELREIQGYSTAWDTSEFSNPDHQIDLPPDVTSTKSESLPDGNSHYFHISSTDGKDFWSPTAHIGPFYIDTIPPGNVKDIAPDSHQAGKWSKDNIVKLHWNPAEDATSGLKGYSILWDNSPGTIPDDKMDISDQVTLLASEPLSDGKHYFHIRSVDNADNWSDTAIHVGPFLVDTSPPKNVKDLVSDSSIGQWSKNDTITTSWKPSEDQEFVSSSLLGETRSEIAGYSTLWDSSADTVPPESINTNSSATSATSPNLESKSDQSYYFHIRSVNEAGLWSETAHLGPFRIDTTLPDNVKNLTSTTHEADKWSKNNSVSIKWDSAEDNISGIKGYSILWDNNPGTLPNKDTELSSGDTTITSEPLSDGAHYFHIRSVDNAGNWSNTSSHIGPFLVDTSLPDDVTELISNSHLLNKWSNNDTVSVNWKPAEDNVSGVGGYSVIWDDAPNTLPIESINLDGTSAISPKLESGKEHYFHIRCADKAGNWAVSASHLGPFMIDTQPPPKVTQLTLVSSKPDEWSSQNSVTIKWESVKDDLSGITEYQWYASNSIEINAGTSFKLVTTTLQTFQLDDGVWYIHIRALDNAGNAGESEHVMAKIDTQPPDPPEIKSDHPDSNVWYTNPEILFEWTSEDKVSGIKGYNWSWNNEESSIPMEQTPSLINTTQIAASTPGIWFLHLRAVDNAGNWSKVSHYRVQVDPSAPSPPKILSDTHKYGEWSTMKDVRLMWETPAPSSGIAGYSYLLDHKPSSIPEEIVIDRTGKVEYSNLSDGIWFFHCRTKSGSGLWGETGHFEIRIDTTPPQVSITYPESDKWYNHPITEYSGTVSDNASGVDWDRFFYQLSSDKIQFHSDIQDKNWSDKDEIPHIDEGTAIFIVTVYDKAGNYSVSQPVNIRVDHSISAPDIMSLTHPEQDKWYRNNSPEISWSVIESYSGIDGYSWIIDQSEVTVPKDSKITDANYINVKDLSDGIWYFHVRALDKAGNWSETAHYKIKVDATPPTVQLKISGQAVTTGNVVKSGSVDVSLIASEPIFDPVLKYKPSSAISPIAIKLTGSGTEWKGSFDVTIHTGDGDAKFFFYCVDQASNSGDRITESDSFRIDTLIRADSNEISQVLCVVESGTKLTVPVGAINQDMRIEIKKSEAVPGTIAIYDFIAYDSQMGWIRDARFRTPVEIAFDDKYNAFNPSVYYWDGVKWNRVKDSITGVRVDYLGRFALINPSSVELSTAKCWAAPNPFTPNGSKDETDRTIFHVVTRDNSANFTINIYDVNGRLIKRIENGNRVWDGTDDRGRIVEGGLYIFQVHLESKIMSGTVVVLR